MEYSTKQRVIRKLYSTTTLKCEYDKKHKIDVTELERYYRRRTVTGEYENIFPTVEYKCIEKTYDNGAGNVLVLGEVV